jgi:hypothetical protein
VLLLDRLAQVQVVSDSSPSRIRKKRGSHSGTHHFGGAKNEASPGASGSVPVKNISVLCSLLRLPCWSLLAWLFALAILLSLDPAPRVRMRSSGLSPTKLRQWRSSRSTRASGAFFPGASSIGGGPPRAVKVAECSRQIWSPPPGAQPRQKVAMPFRQVLLPVRKHSVRAGSREGVFKEPGKRPVA